MMRCLIPGRYVKLFAKAIHCLSKLGEELYVEALPDGLALRTVNLSRSAYACFKFHSSFFLSYEDGSKNFPENSEIEEMLKCKIALKSCLSVFKSMNNIEKSVDRCRMDLNVCKGQLVFLLFCKHGITKTYNLTFKECETLQAVFTKDLCPNFITTQPKVLVDTVSYFPSNQEELSLTVTPEVIRFKNFTEDEPDAYKVIHTQTSLNPEEFDNYQIGVDTDITFCLKELRAILAFGDYSGQPINIHFETGGKPIVFSMDADSTYEADFVLATLVDDLPSSHSSQTTTTAKQPAEIRNVSTNPIQTPPSSTNDISFLNNVDMPELGDSYSDPGSHQLERKIIKSKMLSQPVDESCEIVSDDDLDFVPGTPPSKKFRSMFFGVHQSSQSQVVLKGRILVPDTDDEESE